MKKSKKNKVIIYLQGGIGNIFFQLSAAFFFSKNNFKNIYVVELDKNRLKKIKNYLNIEFLQLTKFERVIFGININLNNFAVEILTRILRKIKFHFGNHIHGGYFEQFNMKNSINFKKNYVLTGYFQHPDFFSKTKNIISDLFIKNHQLSKSQVKDQIAIHLRRA